MNDERDANADDLPVAVRVIWRIMQAVMLLHDCDYHRLRFTSGMSPAGMHVRVQVEWIEFADGPRGLGVFPRSIATASFGDWNGTGWPFAGATITPEWTTPRIANHILTVLGEQEPSAVDPDYVEWLSGLHEQCVAHRNVPIAFADDRQDRSENWEIGWGRSILYPAPPPLPGPNVDGSTGR